MGFAGDRAEVQCCALVSSYHWGGEPGQLYEFRTSLIHPNRLQDSAQFKKQSSLIAR